jgi:hypothetical protein
MHMEGQKKKDKMDYYIETVLNMWVTLECSVFWIGVPLLPLTAERRKRSKEFFHPLHDYIRSSLASVPTQELIEIEKSITQSDENNQEISKKISTYLELTLYDKIYFPSISSSIVFTITFCSIYPLSHDMINTILPALTASVGSIITSIFFILEVRRRENFRKIIQNELNRRKGKFGNFNGIPALNAGSGII